MKSLGSLISNARKRKNLSQHKLAKLLGLTKQTLSRYERDQGYPKPEKLEIIGLELDIDFRQYPSVRSYLNGQVDPRDWKPNLKIQLNQQHYNS